AARPTSRTSVKSSAGAGPRVETYRTTALPADDPQHRGDAVDRVELVQVAQRRLDRRLAGDVGDEHQPGLGAEALLLHRADRHLVGAEHTRHRRQHTGAVEDVHVDVVGGLDLVDGPDAGLAQRPDGGVAAPGAVERGVDDVAEHGAGGGRAAGAPAVEHQVADRGALDEDGVEAVPHRGQRVV